jgi:ankyrin repeat protein
MAKVSTEREKNKPAWIDVKTLSAIRYLHAVVTAGNESAVKQLIRRGIDINAVVPGKGHTVLHQAVFQRNLVMSKLLLDAKAKVDVAGTHGQSPAVKEYPLHRAVGEPQLVKLLLDRGAGANVADAGGMTPLHRAATSGDVDSARLLIQYSAAVNRMDKGGRTPRDIAEKLTAADKKAALRELFERNGGQLSIQLAAKPAGPGAAKTAAKPASKPTSPATTAPTARAPGPATQPTSPAAPRPVAKAPAKPTPVASTPRD